MNPCTAAFGFSDRGTESNLNVIIGKFKSESGSALGDFRRKPTTRLPYTRLDPIFLNKTAAGFSPSSSTRKIPLLSRPGRNDTVEKGRFDPCWNGKRKTKIALILVGAKANARATSWGWVPGEGLFAEGFLTFQEDLWSTV
jgi:hypothetical protein